MRTKRRGFHLIAACDQRHGIGRNNDLPWSLPKEFQHFQRITQQLEVPKLHSISHNSTKWPESSDAWQQKVPALQTPAAADLNDDQAEKTNVYDNVLKVLTEQDLVQKADDCPDQAISAQNCVIMGRYTWLSIPPDYRPLRNRLNLVISRQCSAKELGVHPDYLFETLQQALDYAESRTDVRQVFILGGQQVYEQAIDRDDCQRVYLTRIQASFDCDRFFPPVEAARFVEVHCDTVDSGLQSELDVQYRFHVYLNRSSAKELLTQQTTDETNSSQLQQSAEV